MRINVSLLTAIFCAAVAVFGQNMNTGAFLGTVHDQTGAGIAGATIRIERLDPPLVRELSSDPQGRFLAQDFPPGAYRMTFTAKGFDTVIRKGIEISSGQSLQVDGKLQIGAVSSTVTVDEKISAVETSSPNVGNTIYGEQVQELALNTRSFTQLLTFQPGALSNQSEEQGFGSNTGVSVSFGGAQQAANNITLDGSRNLDPYNGNNMTVVNLDAIAEVRIEQNPYAAEYGRNAGGQVNVITKSGTNTYHGSAFEFFRNDKLNARNFFAVSRPKNRYNNYGWTVGGPVLRNKLVFFLSNEYRQIWQNTAVKTSLVPTDAELAGDFTGSGHTVRDPLTGVAFGGNKIPANRINPNALLFLQTYYLRPTPGFQRGALNFTSSAPDGTTYRSALGRLDYVANPKWNVFGRFNLDSTDLISPYGLFASNSMPDVASSLESHIPKTVNFTANWIPNSTTINTLTVADYHLAMAISTDPTASRARAPNVSIPRIFNTPTDSSGLIPSISLAQSYASIDVRWPQNLSGYTFEVNDTLSRVIGHHTFKFGGSMMKEDKSQNNSVPNNNGTLSFNSSASGDAAADFLLGSVYQYTENSAHVWGSAMWTDWAAFAQDEWRASSRLTLTYGLRWEYFPPEIEVDNKMSFFLPSAFNRAAAPTLTSTGQIVAGTQNFDNGVVVAGTTADPFGRSVFNRTLDTFEPRGGFAYRLNDQGTRVVRGGFGLFHDRWPQYVNATRTNWPFNQAVSIFNSSLSNLTGGENRLFPISMTSFASPWDIPYMMKWSFGVQQQLPSGIVLDASYVGSRGVHLVNTSNINQPMPTLSVATGAVNVNAVRPYPGLAAITTYSTNADSHYHALQISANRRLSKGFSLQASYTFSKSIDDVISPSNIYFGNGYDHGLSNFDRTHVFNAAYVYEIPYGTRLPALPKAILRGWQISGITSAQSGNPLTVTVSGDRAGIGGGTQRANVNGPVAYPGTLLQWFDKSAFSSTAQSTFGNAGRNILRQPGFMNWNLSVSRWIKLKERAQLQIRGEFFNAMNHTQWSAVDTSLGSATFGQVTTARNPRYTQVAARLVF